MNAIIWKEIRQNLPWALLAMLAMTIGAIFVVRQQMQAYGYDPLGSNGINSLSILGLPVVGLLLGLCQTLSEARRDQWAYLVHRPLSRSGIFLGKCVAGLALYLLAGGVPVAGAWLWTAIPGNVPAPFDPRLLLAGTADLLAGLTWYLAALTVGAREARWYGSRILPLGVAFLASCIVVLIPEFWLALAGVVVLAACLATAAWGSFVAGGGYARQPWLARFSLGFSLAVGLTLLGALAMGLLSELLSRPHQEFTVSNYQVSREGQVVKVTWKNNGIGPISITDLEGRPQPMPDDAGTWGTHMRGRRPGYLLQATFDMPLVTNNLLQTTNYRSPARYFSWMTRSYSPRGELNWFYSDANRLVFVYSVETARRIAIIGGDGRVHADGPSSPPRFSGQPVTSWGRPEWLAMSDSVWRPDSQILQLEQVYSADSSDAIEGVQWVGGEEFRGWLIRTRHSLRILNDAARQWTVFPLSHGWPEHSGLSITFLPDSPDLIVSYHPNLQQVMAGQDAPAVFQRITGDGRVVWTKTAPPIVQDWMKYKPPTAEMLVGVIIPPILLITWAGLAALAQPGSFGREWSEASSVVLMFLGLIVAGGVISAIAGWILTGRYAMSQRHRIAWSIRGLALGVLAIVLLFALHELPARVACPACRRKRVVNRDTCEHCGVPFLAPARKGTEIFAQPAQEAIGA